MEPPSAPANSTLRPRWSTWFRALRGALIIPLTVLAISLLDSRRDHGWVVPVWCYFVVFPLGLLFEIWQEYRRRPPVLRYWKYEANVALTVREIKTGKVVLQSDEASLAHRDLSTVPLTNTCLAGVNLHWAELSGRDLGGVDLRSAGLTRADLRRARLCGANLESANLADADLRQADLRQARLAAATLRNADLRGADLRGADFIGRGAPLVLWDKTLGGAQFRGAIYDSATRWPIGFDCTARGCVRAPDDANRLPIPAQTGESITDQLPVPDATPR